MVTDFVHYEFFDGNDKFGNLKRGNIILRKEGIVKKKNQKKEKRGPQSKIPQVLVQETHQRLLLPIQPTHLLTVGEKMP